MATSNDELALQAALDDLTTGQPPPPAGRYRAVRHRVARNRIRRASLACGSLVLAAAAVGAGTGLGARLTGPPPASARHLPAWALPWPDHRNGSVPQRVLDGAVTAWRYTARPDGAVLPRPTRVIWYVGQVLPAAHDVVAIFEVDSAAGPQLVTGLVSTSDVMAGQPAWSHGSTPWALSARRAPSPRQRGLAIGLNAASYVSPDGNLNPDNLIVVLAGPQVRRITWVTDTTTGPQAGSTVTSHGLAVANAGQVTARVQLAGLQTRSGIVPGRPAYVGSPVPADDSGQPWYPVLAAPPALRLPRSFRLVNPIGGVGLGATSWSITGEFAAGTPVALGRQVVLLARCYGPVPLTIRIGTGPPNGRVAGFLTGKVPPNGRVAGVVPCDDKQHELTPAGLLMSRRDALSIQTGQLTSYLVDAGYTG
jgi:hypothetical protein